MDTEHTQIPIYTTMHSIWGHTHMKPGEFIAKFPVELLIQATMSN